ncbi:LLGL scribble cell polarity complex component 2-like [Oppia nitens]|uniref:LLGL scribble cell polarity complex component 2-like n=1 Tax=Oppia nitens TaxID=1686743 RepID=UPI0023DCA92C|nr:LLGL scribble cell polarity complex component 2-like [Oppia nitens]XP_054154461.1 LLGL scribble cell polarity complex component 2-like [Oppia nitens]
MFKFIRGKSGQTSADRLKIQKELFAFHKTAIHGFPNHPSAVSYDHQLSLLAIGTKNGLIRVYGSPGVEFYAQIENESEIRKILFLENRAQFITLSSDNCLHLWEINTKETQNNVKIGEIECIKTCNFFLTEASKEGSLKQITTITLNSNFDLLLIGTQSGNTYLLDVDKFDLNDQIIYQDVVLQNVPDDYKFNPGSVEVIAEQPSIANKFLIGYNRGLLVLWNNETLSADNYYVATQQLESVYWLSDGQQFISAHNDGSYIVWKASDKLHASEPPKIPYGPFPCKAINKIIWKTVQNSDDLIIFSGGMPRATHNDKYSVSIFQGTPESGKHHVLDFTSKVIDFLVIDSRLNSKEYDNPSTLVVLVEEEIVIIDLTHPDWLQHKLPYLSSVHSSAITCCQHYSCVSDKIYQSIVDAGRVQMSSKFTVKEWPINGGQNNVKTTALTHDILVTGHEDGSIRFWDSTSVSLKHLYTLMTSKFFLASDDDIALIDSDDNPNNEANAEDEWPPFRKVGTFDPYSDDPRFAVRKIALCVYTGTLVIGGTAGQVIVFDFNGESLEKPLSSSLLNIVGDKDGFVWKGHSQLTSKSGNIKFEVGYQPSSIVQLQPPAAITALSLYSEWGLIAAGTAHGFVMFDYQSRKSVLTKTTLNPHDLMGAAGGDAIITRRKSFKKSLRESFRRLRKGRSQRGDKRAASPSSTAASSTSPSKSIEEGRKSPKGEIIQLETKPVERQIEARSADDAMGSMVRCLYFSNAFIINNSTQTPTLWAATNAGNVLIYTIVMPSDDKRVSEDVSTQLAKEIHLKHKAPIVAIQIIDGNGIPLPDSYEVQKGVAKIPTSSGHRVLICSEEQFKLFNLPNLKPLNKFKLTAHEGARARRISVAEFGSKSNDNHIEYHLLCLSNQGDIGVLSIPELKRQIQTHCTKREDINGISSLVFTRNGEGFYLHSSSEFRRFSLSAKHIIEPICTIELPEGVRPIKPIAQIPPIAAASVVNDINENTNKETNETTNTMIEDNKLENNDQSKGNEREVIEKQIDEEKQETPNDCTEKSMPTSGIDESPISHNEFESQDGNDNQDIGDENQDIIDENQEIVDDLEVDHQEIEEVVTNGNTVNNGINGDNDSESADSQLEADVDVSNVTFESSVKTNSLDITIDSVKDHITNLSISDASELNEIKKSPSPVPPISTESHPIINSHED